MEREMREGHGAATARRTRASRAGRAAVWLAAWLLGVASPALARDRRAPRPRPLPSPRRRRRRHRRAAGGGRRPDRSAGAGHGARGTAPSGAHDRQRAARTPTAAIATTSSSSLDVSESTPQRAAPTSTATASSGVDPPNELVPPGTYPPDSSSTDPQDTVLHAEVAAARTLARQPRPPGASASACLFAGEVDPTTRQAQAHRPAGRLARGPAHRRLRAGEAARLTAVLARGCPRGHELRGGAPPRDHRARRASAARAASRAPARSGWCCS